jgi:hypothetical protein
MNKYGLSVVLILTSDVLLTSPPDPTGEEQKHTGKEKATFKHGIDAQINRMR